MVHFLNGKMMYLMYKLLYIMIVETESESLEDKETSMSLLLVESSSVCTPAKSMSIKFCSPLSPFDGPFLQRLSLSSEFDLLGGTGIVEMGEIVTDHGGDLLASLRVGDFVPESPFAANECPNDGCLVDFLHYTGNDEALVPSGRCFS